MLNQLKQKVLEWIVTRGSKDLEKNKDRYKYHYDYIYVLTTHGKRDNRIRVVTLEDWSSTIEIESNDSFMGIFKDPLDGNYKFLRGPILFAQN